MPQIDVKITDLDQIQELKNSDLFLIAHPMAQVDGNPIANYPYTSDSISGGALSSAIKHALEGDNLSISGNWNFHTNEKNIPTQDVHFSTGNFITALETTSCLTSMVNDGDEDGWYFNLPTSFCQDPDKRSDTAQSLSVTNNSVANIDFVERAIAGAYKSLLNQLTTIITPNGDSHFIPSHVGEIIYSTTLPPASSAPAWETGRTITQSIQDGINCEDALVKKRYGYGQVINGVQYPDTKWIQHIGYFLRGGNSSGEYIVVSGNTGKPNSDGTWNNNAGGGKDSINITVDQLPLHNHTATFSGSESSGTTGEITVSGNIPYVKGTNADSHSGQGSSSCKPGGTTKVTLTGDSKTIKITPRGTVAVNNTGNGQPIDNKPFFKNVYIWERIS